MSEIEGSSWMDNPDIEVVDTNIPAGKKRLFDAVSAADGEALFVMHPCFEEYSGIDLTGNQEYEKYTSDLASTVAQKKSFRCTSCFI